jgi:hypothetical protein
MMAKKAPNDRGIPQDRVQIKVSKKVKTLHPVVENIVNNLAQTGVIKFIRILPDFMQASNEATDGGNVRLPITKPGHPTAVGISLIIDLTSKEVHFFEITSAVPGYGGTMVDAVLRALPEEWGAVVVMDWSNGFWERMQQKYTHLEIL